MTHIPQLIRKAAPSGWILISASGDDVNANGSDTVRGGSGSDLMDFNKISNKDFIGLSIFPGAETIFAPVGSLGIFQASIERVIGTDYDDLIDGNGAPNLLRGGAGFDDLRGGDENDTLDGGVGSDGYTGGTGADTFIFDGTFDKIQDFNPVDTIFPQSSGFAALALGNLASGAFNTGFAATQADDRIIYDANTNQLVYDAGGVNGVEGIIFASWSFPAQARRLGILSSSPDGAQAKRQRQPAEPLTSALPASR